MIMNLFDYINEEEKKKDSPLALRMRPTSLEEVVGQQHILGEGKLLRRIIQADQLSSLIFYGPPGTGKTTLAQVIAHTTKARFRQINATAAGKKDMEEVVEEAKKNRAAYQTKTILFIDEIHRFNKAQQDYLLPFVEDGTIILIGATTENPFFEVNRALISRSQLFQLKPLEKEDIAVLIRRAVEDPEKGMGMYGADIDEEAVNFLADVAGGDARRALGAVELGVLTTERGQEGRIRITLAVAEECIQRRAVGYDKAGDNHYDVISAFIKSMRGSDPDAALYYLARMITAGEDPKFISRRIMICAAEDVGLADPRAMQVAVAAAQVLERVGMPEGRIPLALAATYVATAPKSNAAYLGIDKALDTVAHTDIKQVPPHLQGTGYQGASELGKGIGYQYAHDFPGHYVKQQYLPDELLGRVFLELGENGYEQEIKKQMEFLSSLV